MEFVSSSVVELVDAMGNDDSIIRAAKVSTLGSKEVGEMTGEAKKKFIDFLVSNRHGSPSEQVTFSFRISSPIFVWREFMRHRLASYNEESGRYKQLEPKFFIPSPQRPLRQVGKPGEYSFVAGTDDQYLAVESTMKRQAQDAYAAYESLLSEGIAREVARMVLPVNIMSTAYVTMNLRSLTNFLSLRRSVPGSTYPSYPQHEIAEVAAAMEDLARKHVPITLQSFAEHGRVGL